MKHRRVTAVASLVLFVAASVVAAVEVVRDFPRGLVAIALLVAGVAAAWQAVRRRGRARHVLLVSVLLLLVGAVVVVLTGERVGVGLVAVALLLVSVALARRVFGVRVALPAADPPKRPIVIWNPKSGGGKAVSNHLADEARKRGIEPIELKPGDDLEQLVRGRRGRWRRRARRRRRRRHPGARSVDRSRARPAVCLHPGRHAQPLRARPGSRP